MRSSVSTNRSPGTRTTAEPNSGLGPPDVEICLDEASGRLDEPAELDRGRVDVADLDRQRRLRDNLALAGEALDVNGDAFLSRL